MELNFKLIYHQVMVTSSMEVVDNSMDIKFLWFSSLRFPICKSSKFSSISQSFKFCLHNSPLYLQGLCICIMGML